MPRKRRQLRAEDAQREGLAACAETSLEVRAAALHVRIPRVRDTRPKMVWNHPANLSSCSRACLPQRSRRDASERHGRFKVQNYRLFAAISERKLLSLPL